METPSEAGFKDDDLAQFEASGTSLPAADMAGHVEAAGDRIWYAAYGAGPPVVFLHGGMGHGGNWAYQVPMLAAAGYRAILIDSRGHGRSSWDGRPFSYELMADDTLAVMDFLGVARAPIVGWSDGACIGLALARRVPERISGVLFFACNVDPSGTLPFVMTPVIERCITRHRRDYAQLSATPDAFDSFAAALGEMQRTQPDYSAADLAEIAVPVTVLQSEHDEFIRRDHAEYLARSIPRADLVRLPGVSHFAPLQRPELFNREISAFLDRLARGVA